MARWRPSRSKAREFAETMRRIEDFCDENGIIRSSSSDSYYFTINGERYRVSNHTQRASDRGMYRNGEKVRESYHRNEDGSYEYDREHEITAGKTRIIEIYTALANGKKLDKRGYVIA